MSIELNGKPKFKEAIDRKSIIEEADKIAKNLTIGKALYMTEYGVSSEAEYKRKKMDEGKIMKHSTIGWNSMETTEKGMSYIYSELKKRGSGIDRFGVIADWVMGVPKEYRHKLLPGTGLILDSPDDWKKLSQAAPVPVHMGDHMIGSLNSCENTKYALAAGITSIGNVSHYYTYKYPGVDLEDRRTADTAIALALMGKYRDRGTIIHSNLDDGFGSQFNDLANLAGWAILERYIVENLLRGGLSHCFGNLFSNPMLRIAFVMTMNEINTTKTPGTMVYGNTTDFGTELDSNFGALSSFTLGDAIAQRHTPSGYAVTAIPVTEAVRIPTADEIIQAHMVLDTMIEKSVDYEPYLNWEKIQSDKNALLIGGKVFFERIMNGLMDLGVNIEEPAQMMMALKQIGASQLEKEYGVGNKKKGFLNGRVPIKPTDIIKKIMVQKQECIDSIKDIDDSLKGVNIVVAATDVHEFGKELIKSIFQKAGANVFDLGSNAVPEEIVETIIETESKIIAVSTYNGIALTYAKQIIELLDTSNLSVGFIMGGLLNENMKGENIPVDVTEDIKKLGVNTDNDAHTIVDTVKKILMKKSS